MNMCMCCIHSHINSFWLLLGIILILFLTMLCHEPHSKTTAIKQRQTIVNLKLLEKYFE